MAAAAAFAGCYRIGPAVCKDQVVARDWSGELVAVVEPLAQCAVEEVRLERGDEHGQQSGRQFVQCSRIVARVVVKVLQHGPLIVHLDGEVPGAPDRGRGR